MTNNFHKQSNALFVALVALCAVAIVWNANAPLMSGDDIEFYAALINGKSVWHGLGFAWGRFFPLAGWNLNLIAQISTNPYLFMIFNALCFIAVAVCFYYLTRGFCARVRVILFAMFVFSVGCVKIYTQITFPDTTQIAFIMIFFALFNAFLTSENHSRGGVEQHFKNLAILTLALISANLALYLKEVSFVIIGGFGFFYLILGFIAKQQIHRISQIHSFPQIHKIPQIHSFSQIRRIHAIFCAFLLISSVIFLGAYFCFTFGAEGKYGEFGVFSTLRTAVVAILGTPLVSIALPIMLGIRAYKIARGVEKIDIFYDALGLSAFLYFIAFLVLGMGSFHYFAPSNILACVYGAFFVNQHCDLLKNAWIRACCALIAFIFVSSCAPQSIHYYTLNKIQNKNLNDAFAFLSAYISAQPTKTTIYFDGFCRGIDRCYNSWAYPALFSALPKIYGVDNFDIKSNEPNGKIFSVDSSANLSFFNSDSVDSPKRGDLIVLSYMSDKFMIGDFQVEWLKNRYELLYVTQNRGYFPNYSAMSLGAYILRKLNINHALNNMGNIFKTPNQVYIFRAS